MKRQYVGIDLHRRSSSIYRMSEDGETLGCERVPSQPLELARAMAEAGEAPQVVIESGYGWYWAADVLEELGAKVHLAHPLGNDWGNRRVKSDERDARDLAAMLRLGRLAEGWIAPPETREIRELVRYRAKLVELRSGLKAQVHSVMAKHGVLPERSDMFGPGGLAQLDQLLLPEPYMARIGSLRKLIELFDHEVVTLEREIHKVLRDDAGYKALQQIPGVGRVLAAIFVAEIGDLSRFSSPEKLCSFAGLTPKHRQSGKRLVRGQITKQGSCLLRWAAIEATAKGRGGTKLSSDFRRIAQRRGKAVAHVAVARRLLTYVYYGLRDKEIRALSPESA